MILVAALTYALHVISFPHGWSTPAPENANGWTSRPSYATMSQNGAVAVILGELSANYEDPVRRTGRITYPAQRVMIVRSDGTKTFLRASALLASHAINWAPTYSECRKAPQSCAFFANVALADDGTPFVTLASYFSGAYSGISKAALEWNGSWHAIRQRNALHGLGKPSDPRSVEIAAADTPWDYAFVGDYFDSFATEDLVLASDDPTYMADVSGAAFEWGSVGLGIGDATAMRGRFVAGFDAAIKLVAARSPSPAYALRWECVQSVTALHPCTRTELGPGITFGVDSRGDVVGDNEQRLEQDRLLRSGGQPMLWRDGRAFPLSDDLGAAYAIAENGTIVGALGVRLAGFIASARDAQPRARPLDPLVVNLGRLHVAAALGVANDGRILALVTENADTTDPGRLAILVPQAVR